MTDEYVDLTHTVVPTAIAYDLDSNDYIIGEAAKEDSLKGYTNAVSFKQKIGEPDGVYKKEQAFFMAPEGNYQSHLKHLSIEDATKIYIDKLLSHSEHPDHIIIGVPTVEKDSWIDNYKRHIRDIFKALALPEPNFYWEPFAVFQYYRSLSNTPRDGLNNVLIIDIGGSTFNSCVVRTTEEGYVAKGSATSVPRARKSAFTGGSYVDRLIVEKVVSGAKKNSMISWKESVETRLAGTAGQIILAVTERAKIDLCKKLQKNKSGRVALTFVKGTLNQDHEIKVNLDNQFIEDIIYSAWSDSWCSIVESTVNEYVKELSEKGQGFEKFDAVVLSGGSSLLPGIKEHVYKSLSQHVNKNRVTVLDNPEYAVAQGIAYQIKELSERKPEYKFSNTSPCVVGDLFIGVRRDRGSDYEAPKVRFNKVTRNNGELISSPIELIESVLEFELELPFKPSACLHVGLFTSPDFSPERRLNGTKEHFRIESGGVQNRKMNLKLFIQDGFVRPDFSYRIRGEKKPVTKSLDEVPIESIDLLEGEKYVGFDFGNSNSYVANVLCVTKEGDVLPSFSMNKAATSRVKRINRKLLDLLSDGIISADVCREKAQDNKISYVYHSNKLENVKISRGETERILSHESAAQPTTQGEIETKNLSEAYIWVLENSDQIYERPKQFISHINHTIQKGLASEAGEYRKDTRKPKGVDFEYPKPTFIESLMEDLYNALSSSHRGNSFEEAIRIHTEFVTIHPFSDGNGRTARLLLTAILLANGFPNIILTSDQKDRYISSLIKSNKGDLTDLVMLYSDLMEAEVNAIKQHRESHLQIELLEEKQEDENDPFAALVNRKYDDLIEPIRNIYRENVKYFGDFIVDLNGYVQSAKDSGKMRRIGFYVDFKEYDIISEETFFDYYEGNTSSLTWAFTLELRNRSADCKLLFAFKPTGKAFEDVTSFNDVCHLIVRRSNGIDYVNVDDEGYAFDVIECTDHQLNFLSNGEGVPGTKNSYFVSTFLATVFETLEEQSTATDERLLVKT